MKKIAYKGSALLLCFIFVLSCSDDSKDPLMLNQVKKGTILALRGQQLQNIYIDGKPGAELFPKIATGTEKFNFDAEILAEDPNTLASFDVFAVKKTGASTTERVKIVNVPFSAFKKTADYKNPWVSVSITAVDIMKAIGLTGTFPLSTPEVTILLSDYKFGIPLECDLNLVNGTVVAADDLKAAGLYQSNQFYPAQKLNYAMTDYCTYADPAWSGGYAATETGINPVYGFGPYPMNLTPDGVNPNKFFMDDFWDCGYSTYYLVLTPSTDPASQVVTIPSQALSTGTISGSGSYNQCLKTMSFTITYVSSASSCGGGATYIFRYDFVHS